MAFYQDYYQLLGIDRNASQDEIRRAYRLLARKYHPDNKTTGNTEKFREITEAYNALSDVRKRAASNKAVSTATKKPTTATTQKAKTTTKATSTNTSTNTRATSASAGSKTTSTGTRVTSTKATTGARSTSTSTSSSSTNFNKSYAKDNVGDISAILKKVLKNNAATASGSTTQSSSTIKTGTTAQSGSTTQTRNAVQTGSATKTTSTAQTTVKTQTSSAVKSTSTAQTNSATKTGSATKVSSTTKSSSKHQATPVNGKDKLLNATISFLESVNGTKLEVPLTYDEQCTQCYGSGKVGLVSSNCTACHGKGYTRKKIKIQAVIPPGISDGQKIRIKEKGERGKNGGKYGDLYIKINVQPHKHFKRRGNDIYLSVPLDFVDACLGATVSIPTIRGETKVKIPPGVRPNQQFKLENKGVKELNGSKFGDQYVILDIKIPSSLSKKQKYILDLYKTVRDDSTSLENFKKSFNK